MIPDSLVPLRIGALAAAAGVSIKACRLYEHRGLIPRAQRTRAGYRIFDHRHMQALRRVCALQDAGFSLREIANLMASADWCAEIRRALQHTSEQNALAMADLRRRQRAVETLLVACARTTSDRCGLWSAIDKGVDPAPQGRRTLNRPRRFR